MQNNQRQKPQNPPPHLQSQQFDDEKMEHRQMDQELQQ